MFSIVRRIILGTLLGAIAGILIGPVVGLVTGIIFGIMSSGIGGLLVGGLFALLMVTTAPVAGAFTGFLASVVKKQFSPIAFGSVVGGVIELVSFYVRDPSRPLSGLAILVISGAITGAVVGFLVDRRLQKEGTHESSLPNSFKDFLAELAKGYERPQLFAWVGFCTLFVVLSFFLMPILTGFFRQMWIWVALFIGGAGFYFGILLAAKTEK